jgi:hypothetical protein
MFEKFCMSLNPSREINGDDLRTVAHRDGLRGLDGQHDREEWDPLRGIGTNGFFGGNGRHSLGRGQNRGFRIQYDGNREKRQSYYREQFEWRVANGIAYRR